MPHGSQILVNLLILCPTIGRMNSERSIRATNGACPQVRGQRGTPWHETINNRPEVVQSNGGQFWKPGPVRSCSEAPISLGIPYPRLPGPTPGQSQHPPNSYHCNTALRSSSRCERPELLASPSRFAHRGHGLGARSCRGCLLSWTSWGLPRPVLPEQLFTHS